MNELEYEVQLQSIDFCVDDGQVGQKPDWWVEDRTKNTWQDTYTARQRVFADGQTEVTVVKERFFVGPAQWPTTRAKRGESEKRAQSDEVAARRAKKSVRLCCKTIGADRMVTLTYRENMRDREQVLKHWQEFCRRMSKVQQFHYVAVLEEQERGALHFHVAVRGRQHYVVLRSIWQRVVGTNSEGQQMAQVNVRDPHRFGFGNKGAHKIASYIAKYCGKTYALEVDVDFVGPVIPIREINQKRYFRSKSIVIPEVISWRLPGCTNMLQAVEIAFACLAGHSIAGLQSWVNNALGIVYLATEPGSVDFAESCPF